MEQVWHLDYLHLLTHKFSIIALSETWLNDMDGDNFKIHGYNLTKVNRQNKGGGRICIFTRENINHLLPVYNLLVQRSKHH